MQNNNSKEKLDIKKRAYQFALAVIHFIGTLPKNDWSCQVIARQLLRSATSIGANIIEAQAGSTRRDFTNFYNHALKSANETCYWLGLLRDSGKSQTPIDNLLLEAVELGRILGASIITLKGKRKF